MRFCLCIGASMSDQFTLSLITVLAQIFIFIFIILAIYVCVLYITDVSQNTHAIRRNYPVIGRFRYFFEHLGTFFRQYFFAMDREELPFNRAVRTWVYRAAKNLTLSNAFGSTNELNKPGTPIFKNAPYPVLDEEAVHPTPAIIGPGCKNPYQPNSYFNISGMSYGALSKVAVEALSRGSAQAGCWLNTGEGGLSPYHLSGEHDLVFQIGTAYYGVRDEQGEFSEAKYTELANNPLIKMFELKLSQGAKPGKGGLLPSDKVTQEIASIRGIPENTDSISPNRHRHIQNDHELLSFIGKLKTLGTKPVGIKFVLGDEAWLGGFLSLIKDTPESNWPDFITLDGAEGGSGAAPQPLFDSVGLPLRESLPLLASGLKEYGLNTKIRLICSGKLVTPTFVAWALCEGADYVCSARGFLFALGCIQAMQCNKNTCPTGITTHDAKLQKGLNPINKAERVAFYHRNMVKSVEMIAHSCGLSTATHFEKQNVKLVVSQSSS